MPVRGIVLDASKVLWTSASLLSEWEDMDRYLRMTYYGDHGGYELIGIGNRLFQVAAAA